MIELGDVCWTGQLDHSLGLGGGPAEESVPDRGTAGAASGHVIIVLTRGTCVQTQRTRVMVEHLSTCLNVVQTVCLVDELPPVPLINHL